MIEHSFATWRTRIIKTFPERQFIHRTGGSVSYFVLGTKTQLAMAVAASVLTLWCLFTLFNVLWGQSPLRSSTKELYVQKEHYERYLVDLHEQEKDARNLLKEQQRQFEVAAKTFEEKHNTILAMITHGAFVSNTADIDTTIYAQSNVLMSPLITETVARQHRKQIASNAPMQTGTVLDASLVSFEGQQNTILLTGETKLLNTIATNRAILKTTGIPINDILKHSIDGMGGPYISLAGERKPLDEAGFLPRMDTIKARTAEAAALKDALKSTPLGHPIDAEHYMTSAYGRRKDPFTKRPTMHPGMDIASYHLAPIVATANGKISFSGRRPGYGRVVEIDHGHGFKTRYAHLEKSYVKRGQTVEKGEKIAGMGSSGRSTSTHLHYEITFQKQKQDPNKFLKAGHYVQ